MKKHKYYYNPKSLSYEKVEANAKSRAYKIIGFLCFCLVFGVIVWGLSGRIFPQPQVKYYKTNLNKMEREYRLMKKELDDINVVLSDLQYRDDNIYRAIYEAEPIPSSMREVGIGGSDNYSQYKGYSNERLMTTVDSSLQKLKRKMFVQLRSYDELDKAVDNKAKLLKAIPAIQPIENKKLTRLASGFGNRIHPIYKTVKFHQGLDFSAKRGTEIYATADGVVEKASKGSGYGNMVVIDHGYGYKTRYAHLQGYKCRQGEKVTRGQLIGTVGSTGLSTAPHLHYEIHYHGKAINPIHFFNNDLSPEEYAMILEIGNRPTQSFD